jgi:hypothetical protein
MLDGRRPRSFSMAYLLCSRAVGDLVESRIDSPLSVQMMLLCYTLPMTSLNSSLIFGNPGCVLNNAVFGSKSSELEVTAVGKVNCLNW